MRNATQLRRGLVAGAAALALAAPTLAQTVTVDPALPEYQPVQGVSGTIKSVGSDTMNNLMSLWAEKLTELYPNVKVEIEGKGSSTAPPALIEGAATFGPMSRTMKEAEIDAFQERFGYAPTPIRTAIDMLAVYVHKDNPVAERGLSLPEVDAIFSQTRKGGHPEDIVTWGQLGLTGEWVNAPISLYGRNSASGTYGFFKKNALYKGDFKDSVKEQPGSSSVVQGIASDAPAIGYSGLGYKTADVAAVPISPEPGEPSVPASPDRMSEYPLSRPLLLYVNHEPGVELDPLRREFLKLVFSRQGQEVVIKDGYLPVPHAIAKKSLESVGIDIDSDY